MSDVEYKKGDKVIYINKDRKDLYGAVGCIKQTDIKDALLVIDFPTWTEFGTFTEYIIPYSSSTMLEFELSGTITMEEGDEK